MFRLKELHQTVKIPEERIDSGSRLSLTTFELVLYAMLGAITFASKILMEGLPNVHLIGMFVMVFALVFRVKGLIPMYVFVLLVGLYAGFNVWWIPYLYIWAVLWGVTMLLPQNMPKKERLELASVYLKAFGLGAFLEQYPVKLSGGMRQKVAISRTLVTAPDIILMDASEWLC